jgi:endoglucanase
MLEMENSASNGMGIPYREAKYTDWIGIPGDDYHAGYEPASNACITNNAMIMAYAYEASNCNSKYLNGMTQAMDYIFGRNGLGISYVTGYGSYHSNNPSHRFWIYELDSSFPMAPSGIMVSGPCSGLMDEYVKSMGMKRGKVPAQKCYADSVASWSTNDLAPDWQASFAWNISFVESALNTPGPLPPITTTSTSTNTTTTTTTTSTTSAVPPVTTSTQEIVPTKKGDTNCDDTVELADAILIMQSLANPNKYGVGGSDAHALTEQGRANADVDKSVKGLTSGDALRIQEYLLHLADSLD